MDELATGGPVDPDKLPIIVEGCDYIIPHAFAKEWARELLDSINKGVIE